MHIRQPIISILAHVDHGKTTLLDSIRQSRVASGEAGGITQHIGASEVPKDVLIRSCGELLKKYGIDVKLPGLLFVDTPGHAAFSLLRKRGGMLADISILVIDVTEGIKPQTVESIKILKQYKTPFIIAANKIDKISGWIPHEKMCFAETYDKQRPDVREDLDMKLYKLIGELHEQGITTDRFDRLGDFTKGVAIVPVSANTSEGIADLLTVLCGLVQKYLEKKLEIDPCGHGKGTVLEVKEVKGLGMTIDVILYDGIVKKGDVLVIGHPDGAICTKVKALFKTKPMKEIRVEKQFISMDAVAAASGVKISAPGLDTVVAGVPIMSARCMDDADELKREVQKEIDEVEIKTDDCGVIIRADALGSLEAIVKMFREKDIKIKRAEIGVVNKKDIVCMEEVDDAHKVIFAFNTKVLDEAEELARRGGVKVFKSDVIYRLIEDYEEYISECEEKKKKSVLESVCVPAKLRFMEGFVFRQSKPAIIGMEILSGSLKNGVRLINNDGKIVGTVHAMQEKGKNVSCAESGKQVAVSLEGAIVGRNIKEGDIFFCFLSKDDYQLLLKNKNLLKDSDMNVLEEIREIMVRKDKYWDVV
ncbi:MAG: translation initiation factor IF-2 [Candidatus Aenigmarchaeota archaeon]|nr:translation initiation factor IF-2 [Candidatus Aenigmarchaeota archaeon]